MIRSTRIRLLPLRKFARRHALLVILMSLFIGGSFAQQPIRIVGDPQVVQPLHVLFIGNSFTYFNNMPKLVESISLSLSGLHIESEMVATGGARLEDLWNQGSAIAAIHKQYWDYVVMNEQSALGGRIVNGEKRIGDPANFFKYAELFDTEIRKAGAKTVIIMTWKDKKDPDRIQNELNSAFLEFRKIHGVILAPVSTAWAIAIKTVPEINLYFDDNHHPSKEGSYLEACTVYATLTGNSPAGAPAKVEGTPIQDADGAVLADKTKTLVNLSPKIATKLQQIAWKAEQDFPH
jgi:hypothetical protein